MHKGEAVAERLRRDWSFVLTPSVILRDVEIPDAEKITYQYLCDHAGTKGKCWVSQKRLAKDRGKGLRTIERHIARLKSLGLIRVQHRTRSSDTLIVDVTCLYTDTKVRYKSSQRRVLEEEYVDDMNGGKKTPKVPAKNGGSTPAKNGGSKEREKSFEGIKPDTSYPGAPTSGRAQSANTGAIEETTVSTGREENVLLFSEALVDLQISPPEGWEMGLQPPRNRQSKPKGMPDQKTESSTRGLVTDADGNPENTKKRSQGKPNRTKQRVHKIWHDWKWKFKELFGVPVKGTLPTGANYGHLKNIVNYCGGDEDYALKIVRYVLERWEEIKKSHFRAERMNFPTLYLVDALKEEIHANIQTGKEFQPKKESSYPKKKEWVGGINRHAKDHSGFEEEEEKQWAEWERKLEEKKNKEKKTGTEG